MGAIPELDDTPEPTTDDLAVVDASLRYPHLVLDSDSAITPVPLRGEVADMQQDYAADPPHHPGVHLPPIVGKFL